ncbi:MAG: NADH-quinone oxidoreductase subunit NuoD [Candidatus Aminicenantes bacterium]|nr:NADH-quinone oxidoreductase subunit NuoD [Candidatus Aminicenantes bacterium]
MNNPEEKEITFVMPFGPQHPASGHFNAMITCAGENVVDLKAYPGYLHRGFEKLMEYRTHVQNTMLSDRVCILDPFSNEMAYVHAAEISSGVEAPERAKYIRAIMAELGRILSHLTWIGIMSSALGLESGAKIAWGDREKIIRLNEVITGGRLYPCYFMPGGVRDDITGDMAGEISRVLDTLEDKGKLYDDFVFFNTTFTTRTNGIGVINAEDAVALGATGPTLRATGMGSDVRKDEPYDAYPCVDLEIVTMEKGDAYSRSMVRRGEIAASISLIRQLLQKMPAGDFKVKWPMTKKVPPGETYFCCEAARGELCFHMVSDGTDKPYRVKIRGPSFSLALAVFPYLSRGVQIADIPAIYWSLDPCPADMDR